MKNAFTIIEVLIVVLIIGIVATLSIPTFQGAMIKAKFPEMFAAVRVLEREIDYLALERGWDAMRTDSTIRSELQALAAELEDEFFQYLYDYNEKGLHPGHLIYVIVKKYPLNPNPYLCIRHISGRIPYVKYGKYWWIVDNHPWGKYLHIEGAFHINVFVG